MLTELIANLKYMLWDKLSVGPVYSSLLLQCCCISRKSAKSDDCCLNKLLYISIGLLNTTEKPSKDVLLDFCKKSQSGLQCSAKSWIYESDQDLLVKGGPSPVTDSK